MTGQECFETSLPVALAAHPLEVAALNTVIRVTLTGPGGGDWTVALKDPAFCRPYLTEDEPSVQAILTMAASDFPAYYASAAVGIQMFLEKKTQVTGPAGREVVRLRQAFKLIP